MFGPSFKSLFQSRWMALCWAAMIVWFAVDFIGTGPAAPAPGNNQVAENATDALGGPVTNEDIETLRRFAEGH
jgi:hypothetical protein